MPGPLPTITDAESHVMEILWQQAPRTSEQVVEALQEPDGWHEKTIRTLLNRLLGKGAVTAERDGRRYLYAPNLTREQWQAQESRSLLDRVFGGKLAPLLAHFSQHEQLSDKDLAELQRLVRQIEQQRR